MDLLALLFEVAFNLVPLGSFVLPNLLISAFFQLTFFSFQHPDVILQFPLLRLRQRIVLLLRTEHLISGLSEVVVMLPAMVQSLLVALMNLVEHFLQMSRFSQFFLLQFIPHFLVKFASLLIHESLEIILLLVNLQHRKSTLE